MARTAPLLIRDGQAQFRDPSTGERISVPESEIQSALADGFEPLSRDFVRRDELGGSANVGTLEFLNSLTFGGTNAFRRTVLGTPQEDIAFQRAIEPEAAAVGQLGGTLASFLVPGGAIARAGKAAQLVGRAAVGSKTGKIAGGLAEGLVSGVGQEIAQLSGEDVSAGEVARRIAKSGAINAAIGGSLGVVGSSLAGGAKNVADKVSGLFGGTSKSNLVSAFAAPKSGAPVLSNLSRIAPKVSAVLRSNPAGAVVSKALGGLALKKAGLGAFDSAASVVRAAGSQTGQTLIRGFTSGLTSQVAGEQRTVEEIEARLQKGLTVNYLASATEGATTGALPPDALPSQIPFVSSISKVGKTPQNVVEIVEDAKVQDVEAHRTAALDGYLAAGFEQESAQRFADFHAGRIELLKGLDTSTPTGLVQARQTIDAIMNPSGVLKRLEKAEPTTDDLRVMRRLYPDYMEEMSRGVDVVLADQEFARNLSAKQRFFFQQVSSRQRASFDQLVSSIQQKHAEKFSPQTQQQAQPRGQQANLTLPSTATGLQSTQASLTS